MDEKKNKYEYRVLNVSSIQPKDGDEDGDGVVGISEITIKKADNGWVITSLFADEEMTEIIEVFNVEDLKDGEKKAVQCIIDSMGLQNNIKIL